MSEEEGDADTSSEEEYEEYDEEEGDENEMNDEWKMGYGSVTVTYYFILKGRLWPTNS